MGGPIDIEQKGWNSVVHDYDHDILVIKVRCKDLLDSNCHDFICLQAIDSSSCLEFSVRHELMPMFVLHH